MKNIDSQKLVRLAYARMTLEQLIETRKSLAEQLEVLDNLIAERETNSD